MSISYAELLTELFRAQRMGRRCALVFERVTGVCTGYQRANRRWNVRDRIVVVLGMGLLVLTILALVGTACGTAPTPTPSISNELESAREALTSYFSLLHAGRYSEAIDHYGGDYEVLRGWNPEVNGDDYTTLFELGCTANGLMCLQMGEVVDEEQVSPTEFRFVVEFINDDGTLFVLGPCCGATEEEMPPQTQFTFIVKKVDSRYLVQDLPVYVP